MSNNETTPTEPPTPEATARDLANEPPSWKAAWATTTQRFAELEATMKHELDSAHAELRKLAQEIEDLRVQLASRSPLPGPPAHTQLAPGGTTDPAAG